MARSDRQPRQRLDPDTRRREILRAAGAVFAQTPYDQVQVATIAAAAGGSEALVFKYYGNKADLYAAVVAAAVERLADRQRAAQAALPDGVPVRDRVRSSLVVYLDHIAEASVGWAAPLLDPGGEPTAAQQVRRQARAAYVAALGELLGVHGYPRHDYAVWGYFGFLDTACLEWVRRGCPLEQRDHLIEAALGALEGGLGDWRV